MLALLVLMNATFYRVFQLRKRLGRSFISLSPLGWAMSYGVLCLVNGIWLAVTGVYAIRSSVESLNLMGWMLFIPMAVVFTALSLAILGIGAYAKFVVAPQTLKSLMMARGDLSRQR
jgi:hypothetical protein